MPKDVLDLARAYIGVKKWSTKHKGLVDAYNRVRPIPVGYRATYNDDWCDIFVTVIGDQAGLSHLIGRECGVQRHINIFKQKGIWKGRIRPQAGDLITFDWDGGGWADHIGFVEKVSGDRVHTIEGNTSQQVARRSYAWNDRRIMGYARPKYETQKNTAPGKTANQLAQEVLDRKWGNGSERKQRLTQAGYSYERVQAAVNQLVKNPHYKTAREVLAGQWGNGADRIKRLMKAGHDAAAIQKLVNQM